MSDYQLGPLGEDDLEPVIAIDHHHSGMQRRDFFERHLNAALKDPADFVYVGARKDGTLAGFALARLVQGEFGQDSLVASFDGFGVAAEHQHHGVG